MTSLRSAVASVLRVASVGLLLLGSALLLLAYAAHRQGETEVWQWLAGGGAVLLGLLVLVCSPALARALTRGYE